MSDQDQPDRASEPEAAELSSEPKDPPPKDQPEDWKGRALRAAADLENFRKRVPQRIGEAVGFEKEGMIRQLLAVVDDLQRALDVPAESPEAKAVHDGVQIVLDHFLAILKGWGVQQIESVGEPFDPASHQAMLHQESAEAEPMTVLAEMERGYRLNGRTLRPAKVTVAKAPPGEDEDRDSPAQE